jgi:hypothetical protein
MGYSRTIGGLVAALAGLAGMTLSDSKAVEIGGMAVQVGGLAYAWYVRHQRGDIAWTGKRTRERQRAA